MEVFEGRNYALYPGYPPIRLMPVIHLTRDRAVVDTWCTARSSTMGGSSTTPPPASSEWIGIDVGDAARELRRVSEVVAAFSAAHALPQRTADAVELVLEEALTNVVMHGFRAPVPDGAAIRVRLTREPAHVCAEVIDTGRAFDPTTIPDPPTTAPDDFPRASGRGIQIMRRLSDRMSYRRRDGWNELHLAWRCPDPPVGTGGSMPKEMP